MKATTSQSGPDYTNGSPHQVTAMLGSSQMEISQVLKLGRGAVVELNRHVGEDIEVLANNRVIARGEVVVVEDRLAVSITDVLMATGGTKRD